MYKLLRKTSLRSNIEIVERNLSLEKGISIMRQQNNSSNSTYNWLVPE